MSPPAKRWARLAEDLEFDQLASARKLAEGWRNGLAGLTALLAAVTVIKGPDSVADLALWARYLVVALLAVAFALLIAGSLAATRAASGSPGAEIFLDADTLRDWTFKEAKSIQRAITRATRCMLSGLAALALAIGLSWLGPGAQATAPLVTVERDGLRTCGTLLAATDRTLLLGDPAQPDAAPQTIPLAPGIQIRATNEC
ncbi:MAG TPA: hypothetical protein VK284_08180 [Streptosporangiaceae bacterium]|nr:hypothetical protein [Streptosporangiaceae bacterium]